MLPQDATPQDRPPTLPPPGWYPGPTGEPQWWDGRAWVSAGQPSQPDRTWAVCAHLAFFAFPALGSLAIRLTVASRDPFVRHHSTEALNAQILFAVIWNVAGFTGIFFAANTFQDPGTPWGFLAAWLVMAASWLCFAGVSIWAAVQAHRGVWWRYPVSVRMVRGAVDRG